MSTDHIYPTILDAAEGLLCEVISILNDFSFKYIIMGGWCPYLRNRIDKIQHPGTKDVDILFNSEHFEEKTDWAPLIKKFMNAGYYLSAKHSFQLLRFLNVDGKPLVFNVDLMHPKETETKAVEFHDIFEFDIPENKYSNDGSKLKSICLPSSACIFDHSLWDEFSFTAQLPNNGISFSTKFPLVNEAGLILSKCVSMKSPKRPRDAFDVYLMLNQTNQDQTIKTLKSLTLEYDTLIDVFKDAMDYLQKPNIFDSNVNAFMKIDSLSNSPSEEVIKVFSQIIR